MAAGLGCDAEGGEAPAEPAERFPGDPGAGRLFLGATVPLDEPVTRSLTFSTAGLTMSRRFYRPHQLDLMAAAVRGDAAARVRPFVSCKVPAPWRVVAEGGQQAWLDHLLGVLHDAGTDVWLALHHEPENDGSISGRAADWVAMQQHVAARAERLAPRVTVVPVLMQWTFTQDSGRDPRAWLVPGARLLGVDVYNRWRPGGHGQWEEFSTLVARVREVVPEVPLVVPELGCRADPDDPLRAPNWLRNAFGFSVLDDICGLAYFDAEHQEDPSFRLDAERWSAWSALAERPEVERPGLPAPAGDA
jgi:hypothetical protein